ncbi:DciA family protein [Azonexus sp. IMCC34839]|uniref:DciA family protein n=1 Tax=Azonexus sp. IMCC34839 TaxID=3133695 RepID=UPI00399A62DE
MHHGPEYYLDNDAAAGRVMQHARTILRLARRFESIVPGGLRHAARVANYKSGKVVIHTDNGAVAAKIRQMSQRLCDELSTGGVECNVMEVKVQPRENTYQSSTSTIKPLSGPACAALRGTTQALPTGPLRSALEHLLERSLKQE